MSHLEKHLDIVWDANHGARSRVFEFKSRAQAKEFQQRVKENKHVKEAKVNYNKLIITYEN